ncbi:MAG: endonuclease domain-containing protein [Candidatus Peregrinibacteria bacterium]
MLRNTLCTRQKPKVHFARRLRKDETKGERILWSILRARRFHAYKFRRQVPLGPFIADFLCVGKKLIVEIDGETHDAASAQARDRRRDAYFRARGFRTLRFSNSLTIEDTSAVLTVIERFL